MLTARVPGICVNGRRKAGQHPEDWSQKHPFFFGATIFRLFFGRLPAHRFLLLAALRIIVPTGKRRQAGFTT
jgi:hypothetical protein